MNLVSFRQYLPTAKYAFERYLEKAGYGVNDGGFYNGFRLTRSLLVESELGSDLEGARAKLRRLYDVANGKAGAFANQNMYESAAYWVGRRDGIRYILQELI